MVARVLLITAILLHQLALPALGAWGSSGCAERAPEAASCCGAPAPAPACSCLPSMCACDGHEHPAPATPPRADRSVDLLLVLMTPPAPRVVTPTPDRIAGSHPGDGRLRGVRPQAVLCIWRT